MAAICGAGAVSAAASGGAGAVDGIYVGCGRQDRPGGRQVGLRSSPTTRWRSSLHTGFFPNEHGVLWRFLRYPSVRSFNRLVDVKTQNF